MAVIYAFRPPTPPNAALELGLAKTLAVYREWAGELADGGDAVLLNDRGGGAVRGGHAHAVRLRLAGDRVHVAPPRRLRAGRRELPRGVGPRVAAAARGAAPRLRPRHAVPAAPPAARPVPAPRHGVLRAQEEEEEPRRRRRRRRGRRRRARHGGARQDQARSRAWSATSGARPRRRRGHDAPRLRERPDAHAAGRPARLLRQPRPLGVPAVRRRRAGVPPRAARRRADPRAVARADDAYFRSFVDFASSGAVEAEGLAATADESQAVLCPDVEVDSWLGIDFYELDFGGGGGGGGPFYFTPSYLPMEGTVFLVLSFAGDGGIDAYVALFETHLDEFKKICYTY
uniref:Uncharacterized protein n=1 Tax=Oryza glaberrima TaxID=4538 RepID=I1PRY1_ORYGL